MVAGMLDRRWRNLLRQILSAACYGHRFLPAGDSGGCGDRYSCRDAEREFKWLLLVTAVLLWVGGWLSGGYGAAVKRLTV